MCVCVCVLSEKNKFFFKKCLFHAIVTNTDRFLDTSIIKIYKPISTASAGTPPMLKF